MKFHRGIKPKTSMDIGIGEYSKEAFDGYRYRAVVEIGFRNQGEFNYTRMDVYTDQVNRERVEEELRRRAKPIVISVQVKHWASKEQDEMAAKFIDETLKDL